MHLNGLSPKKMQILRLVWIIRLTKLENKERSLYSNSDSSQPVWVDFKKSKKN